MKIQNYNSKVANNETYSVHFSVRLQFNMNIFLVMIGLYVVPKVPAKTYNLFLKLVLLFFKIFSVIMHAFFHSKSIVKHVKHFG